MRRLIFLLFKLPWWVYLPLAGGIAYLGELAYQNALEVDAAAENADYVRWAVWGMAVLVVGFGLAKRRAARRQAPMEYVHAPEDAVDPNTPTYITRRITPVEEYDDYDAEGDYDDYDETAEYDETAMAPKPARMPSRPLRVATITVAVTTVLMAMPLLPNLRDQVKALAAMAPDLPDRFAASGNAPSIPGSRPAPPRPWLNPFTMDPAGSTAAREQFQTARVLPNTAPGARLRALPLGSEDMPLAWQPGVWIAPAFVAVMPEENRDGAIVVGPMPAPELAAVDWPLPPRPAERTATVILPLPPTPNPVPASSFAPVAGRSEPIAEQAPVLADRPSVQPFSPIPNSGSALVEKPAAGIADISEPAPLPSAPRVASAGSVAPEFGFRAPAAFGPASAPQEDAIAWPRRASVSPVSIAPAATVAPPVPVLPRLARDPARALAADTQGAAPLAPAPLSDAGPRVPAAVLAAALPRRAAPTTVWMPHREPAIAPPSRIATRPQPVRPPAPVQPTASPHPETVFVPAETPAASVPAVPVPDVAAVAVAPSVPTPSPHPEHVQPVADLSAPEPEPTADFDPDLVARAAEPTIDTAPAAPETTGFLTVPKGSEDRFQMMIGVGILALLMLVLAVVILFVMKAREARLGAREVDSVKLSPLEEERWASLARDAHAAA